MWRPAIWLLKCEVSSLTTRAKPWVRWPLGVSALQGGGRPTCSEKSQVVLAACARICAAAWAPRTHARACRPPTWPLDAHESEGARS